MSFMTDSKIIHEADEQEEFQQNPQYFHRNVIPQEIYSDINLLSGSVNTFLKKFKHSHFTPNASNIKTKNSLFNQMNTKSTSQIDEIASHTQNFIDGLININKSRKVSQSKEINAKTEAIQSQISFNKQFGSQNNKMEHILTKKSIPFSQPFSKKDFKNSYIPEKRSFKSSQDVYYQTVDRPRKDSLQSRYNTNNFSEFIRSPKIQSFNHQLEDFDDQVTVVNEPTSIGKRKFLKQSIEKVFEGEIAKKKQSSSKLTKKKLLEKILNLENTVNQLRFQKYQNQKYRQEEKRNISYASVQERPESSIFSQKTIIANDKASHPLRKKDQNNMYEQPRSFSQRVRQFAEKIPQQVQEKQLYNRNGFTSYKRTDFKSQDKKVSLKQWVDEVW